MAKIYLSYRAGKEGKIKKKDLGLLKHSYRSKEYGYKNHQNEYINDSLTPSNQYFVLGKNIEDAIFSRVDEGYTGKKKPRKDAVIAREIIIQGSGISNKEMPHFGQDSLEWLQDEFGSKNVVGLAIHNDETNPHIHATIVPITKDGRISQKDFFKGPKDLKRQHREFRQHMINKGWDVSLENRYEVDIDSLPLKQYKKNAKEINRLREEQNQQYNELLNDTELYNKALQEVLDFTLQEQLYELELGKEKLKKRQKELDKQQKELDKQRKELESKERQIARDKKSLSKDKKTIDEQRENIKKQASEASERLVEASRVYWNTIDSLQSSKRLLEGLEALEESVAKEDGTAKTDGDLLWDFLKETEKKDFYEDIIKGQKERISTKKKIYNRNFKRLEKRRPPRKDLFPHETGVSNENEFGL